MRWKCQNFLETLCRKKSEGAGKWTCWSGSITCNLLTSLREPEGTPFTKALRNAFMAVRERK